MKIKLLVIAIIFAMLYYCYEEEEPYEPWNSFTGITKSGSMVLIPEGGYMMGSYDEGDSVTGTGSPVEISSFYLDTIEMTYKTFFDNCSLFTSEIGFRTARNYQ